MRKSVHRHGFAPIVLILVLVLLILIGAGYFFLSRGNLLKTPAFVLQNNINNSKLNKSTYTAENLKNDLENASYLSIPQTALEIKTPPTFVTADQNKISDAIDLANLLNIEMPGPKYPDPVYNFKIGSIVTNLLPQEWVLNNVSYQGTKLKDQPPEVSRGKFVSVNGRNFLSLSIGCCGGYERAYFYKTVDKNNSPILLVFITNSISFENRELERNGLLDTTLETIHKVE